MPTIFAANESSVLVDGTAVEGVTALEYRRRQSRLNVYALGSAERIGLVSGGQSVDARLTVASTAPGLDALGPDQLFQVSAQLKRGDTAVTVTFDECILTGKDFGITVGEHGRGTYEFTAARVREEPA
jgi:hypothetical protein